MFHRLVEAIIEVVKGHFHSQLSSRLSYRGCLLSKRPSSETPGTTMRMILCLFPGDALVVKPGASQFQHLGRASKADDEADVGATTLIQVVASPIITRVI